MIKQDVLPKQVLNVFPKEAIEEIVQLRMRIHQQPELAFEEFKTQETLKTFCEALNPKECTTIAQTGLLVRIAGENPNLPPVAVRGDIDALPIVEDTGLEYQSEKKGVMHACGHDVHAAWAAATVYLLSKKPAKRDVIVIFQPAEEQSKGAKAIMQTGKLAEVAMIFGGHVDEFGGKL